MSHDSNRTRIWFPMFSYFESTVDGIIPNEFDTISGLIEKTTTYCVNLLMYIKDTCMLTTRRIWIPPPIEVPKKRMKRSNSQIMTKKAPSTSTNSNSLTLNNISLRRSTGNLSNERDTASADSSPIKINNVNKVNNNNNNNNGPKKDN